MRGQGWKGRKDIFKVYFGVLKVITYSVLQLRFTHGWGKNMSSRKTEAQNDYIARHIILRHISLNPVPNQILQMGQAVFRSTEAFSYN